MFVTTDPEDGATIGLGLVLLPLIGLGLPWSLPVVVDPYRFDELSVAAQAALDLGPGVPQCGAAHTRRRSAPIAQDTPDLLAAESELRSLARAWTQWDREPAPSGRRRATM